MSAEHGASVAPNIDSCDMCGQPDVLDVNQWCAGCAKHMQGYDEGADHVATEFLEGAVKLALDVGGFSRASVRRSVERLLAESTASKPEPVQWTPVERDAMWDLHQLCKRWVPRLRGSALREFLIETRENAFTAGAER